MECEARFGRDQEAKQEVASQSYEPQRLNPVHRVEPDRQRDFLALGCHRLGTDDSCTSQLGLYIAQVTATATFTRLSVSAVKQVKPSVMPRTGRLETTHQ